VSSRSYIYASPESAYKILCGGYDSVGLLYIESSRSYIERWGAGVETQKNVRGEFGGWGRVPFNEPYAPSLSTIYDEA